MRSELRNRAALISYEIARQKVDWGGGGENTSPSPKAGGKPLRDGGHSLAGGGEGGLMEGVCSGGVGGSGVTL